MLSRDELSRLSTQDLLARAASLPRERLIEALLPPPLPPPPLSSPPRKKQRLRKPFDMSRYSTRHVALRIAYVGTEYHGLAWSADTPMTIEVSHPKPHPYDIGPIDTASMELAESDCAAGKAVRGDGEDVPHRRSAVVQEDSRRAD